MKRATAALALSWAMAGAGAAAQSSITNADLVTRAAGDFAGTVQTLSREAGPLWIGYAVPARDLEWNSCCYEHSFDARGCCGRCAIEEGKSAGSTVVGRNRGPSPIALEGGELVVMIRIAEAQVERVRTFSRSCEVDAGGRRVYWLTGVEPAASVAVLSGIVDAQQVTGKNRIVNGALTAVAAHAGDAADRALDRFIAPGRPTEVRKQAAFWAASSRGRAGLELVRRTMANDADDQFRKHAVFAISQSREPEATDALIQLARKDGSSRVRREALFWLAQKAGQKAAGTITDAIENDPDTKVKERAVFALSQLPKDDGVPKLIEVARTNRNPQVRKQAIFWLGQSKDPRALEFFEELLGK